MVSRATGKLTAREGGGCAITQPNRAFPLLPWSGRVHSEPGKLGPWCDKALTQRAEPGADLLDGMALPSLEATTKAPDICRPWGGPCRQAKATQCDVSFPS